MLVRSFCTPLASSSHNSCPLQVATTDSPAGKRFHRHNKMWFYYRRAGLPTTFTVTRLASPSLEAVFILLAAEKATRLSEFWRPDRRSAHGLRRAAWTPSRRLNVWYVPHSC